MSRLPELVERGLVEIATDSVHGAAVLYARALELAARVPADLLPTFGETLLGGRRDMAPLVNLALALQNSSNPTEEVRRRSADSKRAGERIASRAEGLLGLGKRIITISRSSTVIAVLDALKPGLALCLESLPGGEGRRLFTELRDAGIAAELIPDGRLAIGVERAEFGLVGADVITENVVVNKVGTLSLAKELASQGKPLYVVADRTKLLPLEFYVPPRSGGLFEEIPLSLVEGMIDDTNDDRNLSR